MKKIKICKGIGKTKGFGCGVDLSYFERNRIKSYKATYGLGIDCGCYAKWMFSDNSEAKEIRNKFLDTNRKKLEQEKKRVNRELKLMLNTKDAMRLADTYFSRYIRVLNSFNGRCTCFTCGTIKDIKDCDNGHYLKREHKATRYHEDNCKPQCRTCNGDTKHNGKQAEFRVNLVNLIGEEKVVKLEELAKTSIKADGYFYKSIADEYRIKLNELQLKLKVKYW